MRVTNGDAEIDVSVDGEGVDSIVLLHGFPLSREIWSAQVKALAGRARVVGIDLRGMGKSRAGEGPYLMETLAADVAAVLDTLAIERTVLVGHSLGGYVALAFARMFAERLRGLGLVSSRLLADGDERIAARRALAGRLEAANAIDPALAEFDRLFAPETLTRQPDLVARTRALAQRNDPRGAAAMLRGMALRDPADDLAPDLDLPVLIVVGARDRGLGLDEARGMTAAFPNARLEVCPASGHLPMLEEPERVSEALLALMDESATGS